MLKEKIMNLASSWKGNRDALSIIEGDLKVCGEYVQAVYAMEISVPIIHARYEDDEDDKDDETCDCIRMPDTNHSLARHRLNTLDMNLTLAHGRALTAVKRLNRFAAMKNLPALYEGDCEDRCQVAEFCQAIVDELFEGRSLKNVDQQNNI